MTLIVVIPRSSLTTKFAATVHRRADVKRFVSAKIQMNLVADIPAKHPAVIIVTR